MNDRSETKAAGKALPKVVTINEEEIHRHLSEMVRENVEEALNAALGKNGDRNPRGIFLN